MSNNIVIRVHTGFPGAFHETELDTTGMTVAEIDAFAEDFRQEIIASEIEVEIMEDEYDE